MKIDLLESHKTRSAHIEFTSKCNLRCVFCAASQTPYRGVDMDRDTLKDAIEVIKTRQTRAIVVNGHGETTTYNGWHHICREMLEAGLNLQIISNFARDFSWEELHTLSRFKNIEISCDTADPKLFKKLRRGADLKTLCLNISRLKAIAIQEGRDAPNISFSCVVSDQNVLTLPDYVSFGKALGVIHFSFCNLTKYPDIQGALNPIHITEMPIESMLKAKASLEATFKFLKDSGIHYDVQQGLLDTLKEKMRSSTVDQVPDIPCPDRPAEIKKDEESQQKTGSRRYSAPMTGKQTRDCLDPWRFIFVRANRDIHPCCFHRHIYSLSQGESLSTVFNNIPMKEMRRGLLTGNLPEDCRTCPARAWTSLRKLRLKVRCYLYPFNILCLFLGKMSMNPGKLVPFGLHYGQGWYDQEKDVKIENPDWQNWRWTAERAVCLLENPMRPALLFIRGLLDKTRIADQRVIIKINGRILDDFIPGNPLFYKEYRVFPEMMGNDARLELALETDKTFVPAVLDPGSSDHRHLGIQVYQLFYGETPESLA